MKKRNYILLGLLGFLIGYIWYGNNNISVSAYNLGNSDFKIVQLSDYHNCNNARINRQLLKQVNLSKPNIIVITGDIVDAAEMDNAIALTKELGKIAPIYYVTGNHEAFLFKEIYNKLMQELQNNDVIILNNVNVILGDYNLIGINDISQGFANLESLIEKTKYNILLSHRPELIDWYSNYDIDLVLSGHAHGGQWRFFNQGLYAPNQGILPKYDGGKYEKNNTTLIVSRGIGNSSCPIRINNRPEIIEISL